MATFKSTQKTLADAAAPSRPLQPNENRGVVRSLFADYTIPASGFADGDGVEMFVLPAGSRVLDGIFIFEDLGGTGTVAKIGDSLDDDRYATSVDVATAAGSATIGLRSNALAFYETTQDEIIKVILSGATPTAGAKFKLQLNYVQN